MVLRAVTLSLMCSAQAAAFAPHSVATRQPQLKGSSTSRSLLVNLRAGGTTTPQARDGRRVSMEASAEGVPAVTAGMVGAKRAGPPQCAGGHYHLHQPSAPSSPSRRTAPSLSAAYTVAGLATTATWTAVAIIALSPHPTLALPLRHNVLTIAQALAFPVPLGVATFVALRGASTAGWGRLKSATYRRLNLAMAAASLWLAAAMVWGPRFAAGYDMFTPTIAAAGASVHCLTAALCLGVWANTVEASPKPLSGHYIPRIVRGFVGSLWSLPPKGSAVDDPDAPGRRSGAAEYALAAVLFGWFAVLPVVSSFPLATVPSILGKRLSRAASAWTFLGAAVAYVLKDAAERDRLGASTFKVWYGTVSNTGAT